MREILSGSARTAPTFRVTRVKDYLRSDIVEQSSAAAEAEEARVSDRYSLR